MITVTIATKNRPKDIKNCINSLLANSYKNFEVIIADQSDDAQTKKIVSSFKSKKIRYLHLKKKGKSRALNTGIRLAKGDIFAFTDDDCIVNSDWLQIINNQFKEFPDISGLFGQILPYMPHIHKHQFCPSVFNVYFQKLIKRPVIHYKYIGFGGNMAFRKSTFDKIGVFKEWLGPGTVGKTAEDAEFMLRALIHNFQIMSCPKIIIYHNSWIDGKEAESHELDYVFGEIVCYAYLYFQGYNFAKKLIKKDLFNLYRETNQPLKKVYFIVASLMISFFYSFYDPIRHK